MKQVYQSQKNEYGHWLRNGMLAYEVRMTSLKPGDRWRKNHVILCVAPTVAEAILMCCEQYPDDPIIDQVVLRNRDMDMLISGDAIA